MRTEQQHGLLDLTVDIVSAFVGKNAIRASELPEMIAAVHLALKTVDHPAPAAQAALNLAPAVSIKKSVMDDYLICLDDGKRFKSLKRHLRAAYGMSPGQYRAKWGLPPDYPMVAPNYAAARSKLAKASGLGVGLRKGATPAGEPATAPANDAPEASPAKRRGQPKKAA